MVNRKQQAVSPQTKNAAPGKEHARLAEPSAGPVPPWRRWGPYVSDRSWGSVREDYSADGNAWDFLTHDQARSKAYRWGVHCSLFNEYYHGDSGQGLGASHQTGWTGIVANLIDEWRR